MKIATVMILLRVLLVWDRNVELTCYPEFIFSWCGIYPKKLFIFDTFQLHFFQYNERLFSSSLTDMKHSWHLPIMLLEDSHWRFVVVAALLTSFYMTNTKWCDILLTFFSFSFLSLASIRILIGISKFPNNEALHSRSSEFKSNDDSIKGNV